MKKSFSLLLLSLLAISLIFSACKDTGAPSDESNADVSESGNFVDGKYVAQIPADLNYKGRTFTFLTCGVNQEHSSEIVFNEPKAGEETTSGRVNEAVQERNRLVEELLNIEIKEMYVFDPRRKNGEFANTVRQAVAAGFAEFDVVVPCIYDGATLAAGGFLYDLNGDIPYLDMTQPWWEQTFNEELTVNDKLYFTIGDIGLINKATSAALMFNKRLLQEYGLKNPYDLVRDMKWTMDEAFTMVKSISVDEDQDGKITWRDSMGWSGQLDDMWALFYASGEKIAKAGADGYPQLSMYNARSVDVIEKMISLVQDKEHYISANDYFHEAQWPTELTIKPFLEGRCLFFSGGVSATDGLRNMEDDFGILPLPMFSETQDRYYTLINPWVGTCFGVPVSHSEADLEFVGIVLEAIGAESKNLVHPAYYDVALKYQRTRDEDSIEMLDVIFASRGCDIGIIFAWGGLDLTLQELASQPSGTFTSAYQAKEDMAKNALTETIEFFKEHG